MQAQRSVICDRIRDRLIDVGWTPLDLAAAIRTSEKTVYRWTTGEYAPRAEFVVSICRALDVSPMYLLGLSEEPGGFVELVGAGNATAPPLGGAAE